MVKPNRFFRATPFPTAPATNASMTRVAAWHANSVSAGPTTSSTSIQSFHSGSSSSRHHDRKFRPRPESGSWRTCGQYINHNWQQLQVSRRGVYSGGRLQALHVYIMATPRWRIVAVWILTPLPSLMLVLALHCIPLQSPDAGWQANVGYWIGFALHIFVMGLSFIAQLSQIVPELPISKWKIVAISWFVALSSVGISMMLSELWVFPIPFGSVIFSPMFALTLFGFTVLILGRETRKTLPKLRKKVRVYGHILAAMSFLSVAYPAYNAAFVGLDNTQQALFVVMPSVIKFVVKNLIFNACADLPLNDELPELMIFTVDLFNTLYLSACMQTAGSSTLTTVVIFALGIVQLLLAVRDLLARGKHIQWLLSQLPKKNKFETETEQLTAIAVRLCRQTGQRSSIAMSAVTGLREMAEALGRSDLLESHKLSLQKTGITATATTSGSGSCSVSPSENTPKMVSSEAQERLVQQILKTLFTCEYIILAEYVKCVIPLVSMVHTVVLYHLPAKKYFGYMEQYKDIGQMYGAIQKVFLFAALQFLSFLFLWVLLKRRLRHSVFSHLAFVLEHNRAMIQLRLLTWVTYAFLLPIAHGGVDFTFQFQWMNKVQAH